MSFFQWYNSPSVRLHYCRKVRFTMNRKSKILLLSYGAAAVFIAAGLVFTSAGGAEGYRISQGIEYRRAMAQLVSSVSAMDTALEKGRYAEGTGMSGKVCAELMSASRAASTALSVLPLETYALEELAEFLSRMEEYARVKGDLACGGRGFGEADRKLSGQLQGVTGELVPVLANLYTQVSEGALEIRGLLQPAGIVTEEADSYLEDEILRLLEDFPDTPQLIYAGSLSDDYDNSYAALKGLENVTREAALGKAQALAGEEEALAPMGASYGELPCYYFGGDTEHGAVTVSITKQGGLPAMYLLEYESGDGSIGKEAAEPVAREFLRRAGYSDLRLYDTEERDGLLELRYVFADDSATHPDHSVKVAVGQEGIVVSMNATDYLKHHGSDTNTDKPKLSAEEAAVQAVPAGLSVLQEELTWYTRDTGMSVLCHRFVCADSDGRKCVIYADASTGVQVEILTDEQSVSDM